MEVCILHPGKECDHCGECRCQLDPNKVCDNCFRCLDAGLDEYAKVEISEILSPAESKVFDETPIRVDLTRQTRLPLVATLYGARGRYRRRG